MFNKLRTQKYLKTQAGTHQLLVGFFGRVARIARVHHEGLKDKVAKNGREYTYPKRRSLGFSTTDRDVIHEAILTHLKKAH